MLTMLTMLAKLKHGQIVVLPVPAHLSTGRFQANVKAVQCKKQNEGLHIKTEAILYFSPKNPARMMKGILCEITRGD